MAEFHRKIELQSPEDLQYLISNARRAALEMIDKDLPRIEGDDPIRRRVEELVHDWITRTYTLASHNITINGLDPSTSLLETTSTANATEQMVEEHDTFDNKSFEKLKSLARQEEDLVEEIAMLRRKNPGLVLERDKKEFEEGKNGDEEAFTAAEGVMRGEDAGQVLEGGGRFERQDGMEGSWRKAVEGLERLKRTLPEDGAKADRAAKAEQYALRVEI